MKITLFPLAVTMLLAGSCDAAQITYQFSGTATGSLGATGFSGAQVMFSATGDTSTVTYNPVGQVYMANFPLVVNITGFGPATLTAQGYVFDNQSAQMTGFGTLPITGDLAQFNVAFAASYDLLSAIGPLPIPSQTQAMIPTFVSIPTTGGALTIRSMDNFTFQAIGGGVPEPGSVSLLAVGLGGIAWMGRRRR